MTGNLSLHLILKEMPMPNSDITLPNDFNGDLGEWVAYMILESFLIPDPADELCWHETGMEPYIAYFQHKEFSVEERRQIGFGRNRWLRYEENSDGIKTASVVSRAVMLEERAYYKRMWDERAKEDEEMEQRLRERNNRKEYV